uniref:Gamma-tubulin complex component 6 n=1 Tax=Anopheles christyi TaxID=43041 RepID=A0A182JVR3_9DIPT
MHSDSVYRLVDELVEAIGQQCGTRADSKTVKKCKSRAFGILLGKPDRPPSAPQQQQHSPSTVAECPTDPLAMLECYHFEMQMTSRYKYQLVRCERFERLLDQIKSNGNDELAESDRALLQFLLSLKNSTNDCGDILAESPLFGHSKMPAARYGPYPIFRPEDFRIDDRLVAACYDQKANPYLFRTTNGVFTANIANIIANETIRKDPLPADCSYFSDKMASLGHYQGPFRYNLLRAIRQTTSQPAYEMQTNYEIVRASKTTKPVEESLIFGMNWENLGQRYVPEEKPFASECPGALYRFTAAQESTLGHKLPEMKIVSRANFIRDIKFLITGVSSSLFHFDERNRFCALPNITIEDVRIESIQSFIDQALEIGTCFRRLLMMTRKNPYTLELIMEGFVFRAFCESVENFLCCYRVLVYSYKRESILQLLQMLSPANEQLLSMAKLCSLHPGNESDREFPTGSMLLDHLYRELIQVTKPSVSVFLLSTLRRCCLEYFAIFQRWLFQGQLHDPSGELFVLFVDHYRSNTKHFFDKAYFIRRKIVPGFLKGYDEDILLCGKYVMLLRAFRPLHPLFTLRHPELTVCLSFDEIEKLRTKWLRYVAKARQLCGPAVSVRELYETKQNERVEFYRLVEENFRTYMDQWRVEQETEAQEQKRRKQKQMADLLEHLNEIRENKLMAKRQELQEELQLEQVRLEMENRQLLRENLERTDRIKKYTALNTMMDGKLDALQAVSEELSIVPVVTITTDGASEAPFQSCRASNVTSLSIYEDAQKSPALSVDSSPYGADSTSSYGSATRGDLSTSGAEDLDGTIVEGPIVPTVESTVLESDRINSNLPEVVVNEGERNRAKVLGSTVGEYLNEDHANANIEQLVVATASAGLRKLTEAQRNKLKILSQEFEIAPPDDAMDVNCNRLAERRKNRERILISDYTSREEEGSVLLGGQATGQELTDLQKNRRKIMSQEYNLLTDDAVFDGISGEEGLAGLELTDLQKNRRKVMSQDYNLLTDGADLDGISREVSNGGQELTDLQKNRRKIMSQDYNLLAEDAVSDGVSREVGQSTMPELTELQKNRRKIMSQEYNLLTEDAVWDSTSGRDPNRKPTMYLNLDSDRARNRRRIMESEFDIATGVDNFLASPMSVDSDTVDESSSPSVAMIRSGTTPTISGEKDVNANPVLQRGSGLKLDVLAAADAAERFGIERRFGIPDTAALELETPASAMKATGEMVDGLDGGFDFTRAKALERRDGTNACNSLVPASALVPNEITQEEDDEIYREFVAAMKQQSENFCRLAIPSPEDSYEPEDAARAQEKELNSVDVLTITRFLQYSLVIPLKAHMEIVNNEILKMYLYDLDVLGHFESLRNYFLLMDGEFSTHICDNLFNRLETVRTPEELLNYQTLHFILDGALYSSNAGTDRNADRLSFIVCQIPEKFDLYSPNVFSMLNLSYRVEWPLNLIFSNETIEQYTNVFKYLVKVRRVSYVLEDSFQLLKEASKRLGKPLLHSPQYARVQLIRHKLSHLVNALKNYITSSALHASWETFREDLQDTTETMEDLFRKHRTYLKRVIFLCLLNRRSIEFYNNIEQIFRVVLRFYRHLRSKEWRLQEPPGNGAQQYYVHPRYRQILDDEIDFEKLIKYTIFLGNKMYDHGYQKEISEFLHVININGYYDDVKPVVT